MNVPELFSELAQMVLMVAGFAAMLRWAQR